MSEHAPVQTADCSSAAGAGGTPSRRHSVLGDGEGNGDGDGDGDGEGNGDESGEVGLWGYGDRDD